MSDSIQPLTKDEIEAITRRHINAGKVEWMAGLGIDLVEKQREGCYVWDLSGRKILDALCDGSTYTFGHRHPELVRCLVDALQTYDVGCQFLSSQPRAEFVQALISNSAPGLTHAHLLPSGSEANDAAIKAARAATGRRRIVVIEHAFHGVTGLSAQASGGHFARSFMLDTQPADWIRVPWNDIDAMRQALAANDVAAVLLETIPATLGWPLPTDDYLPSVRRLCDESDSLLIVDEVQTGYGRLGTLWGIDRWQVEPDMLVMAKGAGGGLYPLAFVLMNDRAAAWVRDDPLGMPSTFGGSELGCVVGKRALELVLQPGFLSNVQARHAQIAAAMVDYQKQFSTVVTDIRHLGLALAIQFTDPQAGLKMMAALYRHDVLAIMAAHDQSVLQIKPPLIINERESEELMRALWRATHDCFVSRSVSIRTSAGVDQLTS